MTKTLRFVAITFALSWALAAAFYLAGFRWQGVAMMVCGAVYMWMPGIVAILLTRYVDREPVKETLGLAFSPNRYWLVAALLPAVLAIAAFGVGLWMPGASYDGSAAAMLDRYGELVPPEQRDEIVRQIDALPIPLFWVTLLQGVGLGATLNVPATLGEELGWRAYLTRALGRLGWLRASLLIGVIWGIWHAPLILMGHNYPQHPQLGVGMMVLFCAAVSPVIAWVRERAGSVWAAAIFHGALNGTAGVAIVYLRGGSDLQVGMPGLAGILSYTIVSIFLAILSRERHA